jgi:uncharacterized protein YlbG (UPF0298 family)
MAHLKDTREEIRRDIQEKRLQSYGHVMRREEECNIISLKCLTPSVTFILNPLKQFLFVLNLNIVFSLTILDLAFYSIHRKLLQCNIYLSVNYVVNDNGQQLSYLQFIRYASAMAVGPGF